MKTGYFIAPKIGTSSTVLLTAGNHRHCVEISNPTLDGLFIAFGTAAAVNSGFYLPPNQRPYRWTKYELGALLDAEIYGIFNSTAGTIGVLVGYD